MASLVERYASQLVGVLSCFDRMVITGTIPGWCHAEGMARYVTGQGVRLFDYAKQIAEPLRDEIVATATRLAQAHGLEIEFIRKIGAFRKEDRIQTILATRGTHPGLVHIFSALETCPAFTPWHDKSTGYTVLRGKTTKCLHYYFYFIDSTFGLCYLRVPTWAPFRLQFYCNGHAWLATRLRAEGIACTPLDNTFLHIADLARAQELADAFPVEALHRALDAFAQRYCPVIRHVPDGYHWSLMQIEYATDLIFRHREDLSPLYATLIRTAIHTVQPEQIAMFLGKKLDGRTTAELGTEFRTRAQGTCVKHYLGWAAIKMYDKQGIVLRIETTVNNVTELKHYRTVEHRDGTTEMKYAPMQKTIYSLPPLRELLHAANQRYLDFLADLDDPSDGQRHLTKLGPSRHQDGRSFRGFNLFRADELTALGAVLRGEGCISGITNRMLRRVLADKTSAQISYFLKRCRVFGLLKKCGKRYKYYLTKLGRRVLLVARKLQEFLIVPTLAGQQNL
jgi:hypothetical protein